MDRTRLSAYLKLIETLLTCPQGEEWIYLKHYEEVVDAEFLQLMEQVAIQLGQQDDPVSATFLHNWAAKLHHIWLKEIDPAAPEANKTEAYMTLIQQLLDCPEGMEEHLLIANEPLIGLGLVHKMREVSKALKQQGEEEPAEYLEVTANELSQGWLVEHGFSARLEKPSAQSASQLKPQSTSQQEPQLKKESESKSPIFSSSAKADDALDDLWFDLANDRSVSVQSATSPSEFSSHGEKEVAVSDKAVSISNGAVPLDSASERLTQAVSPSPIQPAAQQAIAQGLQAIAEALQQLNQTLTTARPPHLLHHLEVLEKACAASWQLTTEELEQLLGVKPKCHGHETVYRRGEWCFTKVGKVGSQTAWKVTKAQPA